MNTLFLTMFCIGITIGVYLGSLWVFKHFPTPFTMPVFLSTFVIILVLLLSGVSYADYTWAKDILTFLLGPATVALAAPLYQQRQVIFKNLLPIFVGIFSGTMLTIIVAIYMATFLGLTSDMIRSFSVKSITIPIANEVAPIIQAEPLLVMLFVMITGMSGAMFGAFFLKIGGVTHPMARGLSYGTISHGIGTSQAIKESPLTGASSSVAMGLTALITSIIVPWLLPLLL